MDNFAKALVLEVWRGGVRAWECDEMGHQNARFYFSQAMEGLGGLWATLCTDSPGSADELAFRVHSQHIRFLREIRAGTPLHMSAGLVSSDESRARVVLALINSETDECSAILLADIECVSRRNKFGEHWPRPVFLAMQGLLIPSGSMQLARGLADKRPERQLTLQGAVESGLVQTALGVFDTRGCDSDGVVTTDAVIGRVCDATRYLCGVFQRTAGAAIEQSRDLGTASLECRFDYYKLPPGGTRVAVRSAFADFGAKTRRLVHWVFDVDSGFAIAAVNSFEVNFDMRTRKAVTVPAGVHSALAPFLVGGL